MTSDLRAIRLPALLCLALVITPVLSAQEEGALDFFNSATSSLNGSVRGIATQPDGKIVAVGNFTAYGATSRNRVARFHLDGTLDLTFNPGLGPNAIVHAVTILPNDKIVIGGEFTTYAGQSAERVAILHPDGSFDTVSPTPGVNGPVYALTTKPDGTGYYVGGNFTRVGGGTNFATGYFAEFLLDGSYLRTVQGIPNGAVRAIAIDEGLSSNTIIIGGDFTFIGTGPAGRFAFLSEGLFVLSSASNGLGQGADGPIHSLAVLPRGSTGLDYSSVVAGGQFTEFNGDNRDNLAHIAISSPFPEFGRGDLIPLGFTFRTRIGQFGWGGPVHALAYRRSDHRLLVGGSFNFPVPNLVQLDPQTGSPNASEFNNLRPNTTVRAITLQADGMPVFGGDFIVAQNLVRRNLARAYGPAGSARPSAPSFLLAGALGDTVISLQWTPVDNLVRYRLERFISSNNWEEVPLSDPQGTSAVMTGLQPGRGYIHRLSALNGVGASPSVQSVVATLASPPLGVRDPSFSINTDRGLVQQLHIDPQGRLVLRGSLNEFDGQPREYVARLNPDGSLDPSFEFTSRLSNEWPRLIPLPDGKFLARLWNDRLVRLLDDGSIDPSFPQDHTFERDAALQPDRSVILDTKVRILPDGSVDPTFQVPELYQDRFVYAVLPDGSLIVSGLVKLTPDGALDPSFSLSGINSIFQFHSLVAQSDGKFVVSGQFEPDSPPADWNPWRVIRLHPDGSLDTSYGPGGFGQPVLTPSNLGLQILPDDRVVVRGSLTGIGNQPRLGMARLNPDGSIDPRFTGGSGWGSTLSDRVSGFFTIATTADGLRMGGTGYTNTLNGTPPDIVFRFTDDLPTAPAVAPASLAATADGPSRILLTWPRTPNQTAYLIERSANGIDGWTEIARPVFPQTQFVDTGVPLGNTFHYRLRGQSGTALSADPSPVASATSLTGFQAWLVSFGLPLDADPTANHDRDPHPLLHEFALFLDPTVADPVPWWESFDAGTLRIATERPGVTYTLEQSANGVDWSAISSFPGSPGNVITIPTAALNPDRVLRLRVTLP